MSKYSKQFDYLNLPEKKRPLKERVRKWKYKNFLDPRIEYPHDKFVIYTRGRTGSTVLTDLLNCHPDIFCDVEIFNYLYCRSRVMFPELYIKSCSKRATLYDRKVYGFKVKIVQLRYEHKYSHYERILTDLSENGWKFIHLKRMNFLRHKLSSLIATESNVFHLKDGEEMERKKIVVDYDVLLEAITYGEEVEKTEEENLKNIPHIKVIYETDLLDNSKHQDTADKVFEYLGLAPYKVSTEFKRITTDKLEDLIANYEEIEGKFRGTKYEKYLN